jgi:steroid delta-isomerase-like uncharacterized protein
MMMGIGSQTAITCTNGVRKIAKRRQFRRESMSKSTTRRTFAAAALVTPVVVTSRHALAQEGTPAAGDVESIVRSFYEPFNTGDTAVYDTILAEDWVDTPTGPGQQPGRAGFPPVIEMFRTIFPDLQVMPEDVIVSGNKAAVRSTIRGTHEGELFGIPGTGQPVEFMAIDIHELENGQIVHTWHVEDFLSVLFQIGAFGPAAGAGATPTGG